MHGRAAHSRQLNVRYWHDTEVASETALRPLSTALQTTTLRIGLTFFRKVCRHYSALMQR
jgi:hypothetical protein